MKPMSNSKKFMVLAWTTLLMTAAAWPVADLFYGPSDTVLIVGLILSLTFWALGIHADFKAYNRTRRVG